MATAQLRPKIAAVVCALWAAVATARAAGFAIDYESARSIGWATAGSAAAADASTIFTNPAGLGFLKRDEILGGGQFLLLKNEFQDNGSTILGGTLRTPGGDGGNAIPPSVVPWVYTSHRLTPQLTAGLGLFSPAGLRTDWGPFFVGRYQNEVSSLALIDLNPTLAYHPDNRVSLAAGLDVQYARLRLTQAIDFGSSCAAALGPQACGAAFGLTPGGSDGQAASQGESFGFGFTAAALVEPTDGTRVGLSYRSRVDHHFSDLQQRFVVNAGARAFLSAAGSPLALTGSRAETTIPVPARLTLGIKQRLSNNFDLLLDSTLTFWDVFDVTTISARNTATGVSAVTRQGYRNAWRVAAALEYTLDQKWALRAGVAYDQTPIPANLVQAVLPDRDRVYVSVGASYQPAQNWGVDVGYSHLFATGPVPIDRSGPSGDLLKGRFSFGGDVFAAQMKYQY